MKGKRGKDNNQLLCLVMLVTKYASNQEMNLCIFQICTVF